jgi:hypothetical protein
MPDTKDAFLIVVPYRDRKKQLDVFVKHMHAYLPTIGLDFEICVVEQGNNKPFNRAKLLNIGFLQNQDDYSKFIFHDVDVLPLSSKMNYICPSVGIIKHIFGVPHSLGGCMAMLGETFSMMNGFSNNYWGWGREDADLQLRAGYVNCRIDKSTMCQQLGQGTKTKDTIHWARPSHQQGIPIPTNHEYYQQLVDDKTLMNRDGLNSCEYKIISKNKIYDGLATLILCDI